MEQKFRRGVVEKSGFPRRASKIADEIEKAVAIEKAELLKALSE